MWFWGAAALAQSDYAAEAEARMGLSFDLEAVEEQIAAPAAPDPMDEDISAPRAAARSYPTQIQAPPGGKPLPLEPNSSLQSVTVFQGQAFVTRSQSVSVPAGSTAIRFEGLPHVIRPDALSARVIKGDARIVGVELRSGAGKVEDSARIESVRAEAEKAVEKLGAIRDRIEALLAQRAYLRSALVPEGVTETPSVRKVHAALEYAGDAELKIAERLRKEEAAAQELDDVVVPLLRKLADPLATGREVWVEVEAARSGSVEISLRYAVNNASWSPAYNARLDPQTGQVELEVFGVVAQSTAEDWRDASIFLATANPYSRANAADLVPWTLGRSGSAGVFDTLSEGEGLTGRDPIEAPADRRVVETRMDARVEGSGTVVLAIEGQRTIRGDGSPQRLPVALQRLESEVALSTVPKLNPSVQRRATVRYDGAVPLLPGPVSSFVLSDYVGAGQIREVVQGEGVELDFGTDERFRVSRKLVDRQETRVGQKSTRYDFRFRTAVTNHGSQDAVVAIADQLPRSEDVHIVVEARDVSGGSKPGEDGLVRWSLPVPAGGTASVDLAFSVTVPDNLSRQAGELVILYLRGEH